MSIDDEKTREASLNNARLWLKSMYEDLKEKIPNFSEEIRFDKRKSPGSHCKKSFSPLYLSQHPTKGKVDNKNG